MPLRVRPGWRTSIDSSQAPPVKDYELVSSEILNGFEEEVLRLSGDPQRLLEECGIDPTTRGKPNTKLLLRDVSKLLETTSTRLKCTDLGMRIGARQDGLDNMGRLRPILESARTIEEYYLYASRHMYVYTSAIDIHLEKLTGDRFLVRFDLNASDIPFRRQIIEQALSINRDDAIRLSQGRVRAREIWFSHSPLSLEATYHKRYTADVRFSQPVDGVVYSLEDIRTVLPTYDPKRLEEALQSFSLDCPPPDDATIDVKRAVHYCTAYREDCTREAICELLGIHPRTLHRRLQAEGKTFEDIKDEVRRDMVAHYLMESDLSLTDITERLRYSEATAFSRACRRWFGVSPGEMRSGIGRNLSL